MCPEARTPREGPRFYTVAEAARILRVSPMTLYRAIGDGEFPALRVRTRLIVPAKIVDDMAAAAIEAHSTVRPADWLDSSSTG